MQADDLPNLGEIARNSAIVLDNGEVVWPFEYATYALAHLGRSQ